MMIPKVFANYVGRKRLYTLGELFDSESEVFCVQQENGMRLMSRRELFGESLQDFIKNIENAEIYEMITRYKPSWGTISLHSSQDTTELRGYEGNKGVSTSLCEPKYFMVIEVKDKSIIFLHKLAEIISRLTEDEINA